MTKNSNLSPVHAAIRMFLWQWLVIVLVLPILALGFGHLLHVSAKDILHNVILAPRNLSLVPLTLLIAGRTWCAYKFEGHGRLPRNRRRAISPPQAPID